MVNASQKVNVGINGFGRIGKLIARQQAAAQYQSFRITSINDPGKGGIQAFAHRFKYDSTYGTFKGEVAVKGNDTLFIEGLGDIKFLASLEPNWGEEGVSLVLESSGIFVDRTDEKKDPGFHINNGAARVLISAPTKGADGTFVFGVNHETYNRAKHLIMSGASCTTNCLAPVAMVLDEEFGIVDGIMTTVHAPTAKQPPVDGIAGDRWIERSVFNNIIPNTTGAAKAVGEVLPQLKGKLTGRAFRIASLGSVVDLDVNLAKDVTADDIRAAMKRASEEYLKDVLAYNDKPLVSTDFIGTSTPSIFDANPETMIGIGRHWKMTLWYDNEYGFTANFLRFINYIAEQEV